MKRFVGLVALFALTMPTSSASAGDGVYVYLNDTSCRSFYQDEYPMARLGASLSPRVPPDAGTLASRVRDEVARPPLR